MEKLVKDKIDKLLKIFKQGTGFNYISVMVLEGLSKRLNDGFELRQHDIDYINTLWGEYES